MHSSLIVDLVGLGKRLNVAALACEIQALEPHHESYESMDPVMIIKKNYNIIMANRTFC